MKEPKITNVDFDDLVLPETIYKYRTWSDINHKSMLSGQIVYMSSPMDFEDTKDCRSLKRYDLLTDDEIYNYYLNASKRKFPERSRQQHQMFARDWFKKSLMHHPEDVRIMQEKHLKEFAEIFGVLSLTANPLSEKMWSKYSDDHKGICIGFDPKVMFPYLGGGGIVNYYDSLPIIYPNDSFDVERYKQIFCKERKWEFEMEYRTTKTYKEVARIEDRMIKLPKECFKEIIFGFNTTDIIKAEITDICVNNDINVKFKQVISKMNDDIVEIEEFKT